MEEKTSVIAPLSKEERAEAIDFAKSAGFLVPADAKNGVLRTILEIKQALKELTASKNVVIDPEYKKQLTEVVIRRLERTKEMIRTLAGPVIASLTPSEARQFVDEVFIKAFEETSER